MPGGQILTSTFPGTSGHKALEDAEAGYPDKPPDAPFRMFSNTCGVTAVPHDDIHAISRAILHLLVGGEAKHKIFGRKCAFVPGSILLKIPPAPFTRGSMIYNIAV